MNGQLELSLNKAPAVAPDEVAQMVESLRGKGWQTTTQLGAVTWNQKRKLRAIAAASDGRIVSWPGSPGYKLFDECTPEEFRRADNGLAAEERGIKLTRKNIARRMHELGVVFPSDYQPESAS